MASKFESHTTPLGENLEVTQFRRRKSGQSLAEKLAILIANLQQDSQTHPLTMAKEFTLANSDDLYIKLVLGPTEHNVDKTFSFKDTDEEKLTLEIRARGGFHQKIELAESAIQAIDNGIQIKGDNPVVDVSIILRDSGATSIEIKPRAKATE